MAQREHQGYQIALVIFVMLTVLLSITTFMFFKKFREEQQKNTEVTQKYNTATSDFNASDSKLASVMQLIGYDKSEPIDTINRDVEQDRKNYSPFLSNLAAPAAAAAEDSGEDAPQATEISNPLNYREVAKMFKVELEKRSADFVKLTADKQALEATVAANRTEDKNKNDALLAGQTKAQEDAAKELAAFNKSRGDHKSQLDLLKAALTKKDEDSQRLNTELSNKIAELNNRDRDRNRAYNEMRDSLAKTRDRHFETTDGRITAVLARERMVYINLGSADGLRAQVTFSVYGQDSAKLVESESKADIEVTQISGPHSAIARVLSDSRSDPILPGDAIFSPAFHPGTRIHFAIVGETDIDGDGDSDRQRVRDLIATNNGIIDIEIEDDGKVSGQIQPPKITASTQYLIKGNPPADDKVLAAYSRVIGEADAAGTVTLTMQQFLNMVGYKTDERTVGLGKGADPRDFPPKASTSAYDKPGATKFRERRPEAAAKP
ncbi:MAG: hypothetical protein WD875_06850 [Pirellulales bacterium]